MTQYYIGVMSGTSLDGVDIALMDFSNNKNQVVDSAMYPMPDKLYQQLSLLHSGKTTLQNLGEIDVMLGHFYAQSINQFLIEKQLHHQQIKAIGCHGQTIWHSPDSQYPFTMQIGDANVVAKETQITTIADFRRKDMAYGGQGAPLVPAFHQAIFAKTNQITAILNIGGISNISLLIPGKKVIGFDTGPGNALMDLWIFKNLQKHYDQNGDWAKMGSYNNDLLNLFLEDPYFSKLPPKSTGREYFNMPWLEKNLALFQQNFPQKKLKAEDIQATLVKLTTLCSANSLIELTQGSSLPCHLLLCGGGARNHAIKQALQEALPLWQVKTTSEEGIDTDFVEAAAFAWLAYCKINNLPSNLPEVTGASKALSLGVIYEK